MFNKKPKRNPLADRTGTYTPDIDDRRRIVVCELIMVSETQGGALYAGNLMVAVEHNLLAGQETAEREPLAMMTMKRLSDIASGRSEY